METPDTSVDVLQMATRLAEILREDPQALDKAEYQRGERQLTLFQDANFGPSFNGLKTLKIEVLSLAIDDLANRAKVLSNQFMGVAFAKNKLGVFLCDHGQTPQGTVVYKIGLRDVVAFQKWRTGQNSEITPEDLHAAIYRLTVEWARLG